MGPETFGRETFVVDETSNFKLEEVAKRAYRGGVELLGAGLSTGIGIDFGCFASDFDFLRRKPAIAC
jgi:hypothetical protein